MKEEDIKAEIVCILNNQIGYKEDNSEELENYWVIAEEIFKLFEELENGRKN